MISDQWPVSEAEADRRWMQEAGRRPGSGDFHWSLAQWSQVIWDWRKKATGVLATGGLKVKEAACPGYAPPPLAAALLDLKALRKLAAR